MKATARKLEQPDAPILRAKAAPRRQAKGTEKVSVTIEKSALRWLTKAAKRDATTVSAKMTEAITRMRRDEARDRLIAYLGVELTDEDRARIDAEWA
jgi:hypothetical protein